MTDDDIEALYEDRSLKRALLRACIQKTLDAKDVLEKDPSNVVKKRTLTRCRNLEGRACVALAKVDVKIQALEEEIQRRRELGK